MDIALKIILTLAFIIILIIFMADIIIEDKYYVKRTQNTSKIYEGYAIVYILIVFIICIIAHTTMSISGVLKTFEKHYLGAFAIVTFIVLVGGGLIVRNIPNIKRFIKSKQDKK